MWESFFIKRDKAGDDLVFALEGRGSYGWNIKFLTDPEDEIFTPAGEFYPEFFKMPRLLGLLDNNYELDS